MNPLIIETFNKTVNDIIALKNNGKSLKSIYNNLTRHNTEIMIIGDYQVVVEILFDYSQIEVSIWYEPDDFSKRCVVQRKRIEK
jgi:hypothetical protein